MLYFLENESLIVRIDSKGGEVKSVLGKSNYREYMWIGNGRYWGRTSPVLFPFVGSLSGKKYIWQGKEYPMGQHGFARDCEFTLDSQTDTEIWFRLESSEATLKVYPFPFVLRLGYRLEGRTLNVLWEVQNSSDSTLHFSIGAHPAFLCPIHGETSKAGYYLSFDGVDEIHHYGNSLVTGLAMDEDLVLPLNDHKVRITPEFFDRATYIVTGKQTGKVSILDPDEKKIVEVDFDAPLFGIWSPEGKNAPFLCIEPWYGQCDFEGFNGTLEERPFANTLPGGETFRANYSITYYEI